MEFKSMIVQTYTYKCTECGNRKEEDMQVPEFTSWILKPQIPEGWNYVPYHGLFCPKHASDDKSVIDELLDKLRLFEEAKQLLRTCAEEIMHYGKCICTGKVAKYKCDLHKEIQEVLK